MPVLAIDLQDGFFGDDVVFRVNGEQARTEPGVRTKRTLGKAKSLEIEIPDGNVTLEVEVPTKGIAGKTEIHHKFLGVSIAGKDVQFIPSDNEFGYG